MLTVEDLKPIPEWFYENLKHTAWCTQNWLDAYDWPAGAHKRKRTSTMTNWILIIVIHGECRITYRHHQLDLKTYDATLLPPGTWHSHTIGNQPTRVAHIPVVPVNPVSMPANPLEDLNLPVVLPLINPDAATEIVEQILSFPRIDKQASNSHLAGNIYLHELLFNALAGGFASGQLDKINKEDRWVVSSRKMMRNRFREPDLTVQLIADEIGVSRNEFMRRFKEAYGISPKQWLQRYRITIAAKLLKNRKNITIDAVMKETGFRSRSAFYNMFDKYQGCKPSKLR